MNGTNTGIELYDDNTESAALSQEELLMSESEMLAGLLELGRSKNESQNYRKIQIKRGGIVKLEFRIRPISEDESQTCWRHATRYAPSKPGQPKKAIDTDNSKFRSYLIYTATVNEDRAKLWDNRTAQEKFNVLQAVDMIDCVLLAGEKSRILDMIDEISGFDDELEESAKN